MNKKYNVLILGASYGSLLGIKLGLAGHDVTLVCLPAEAELINKNGARVRLPVRGRNKSVEIDSRKLPGKVSAAGTIEVDPKDFDLIGLAMQEPQYHAPCVRKLLDKVARSKVPCLSIMNMSPLPFLARIPGLPLDAAKCGFIDPGVWSNFEPGLVTLCSPDPQAFRLPGEPVNILHVGLATNFKAARFESDAHTAILRKMQDDIDAIRFNPGDGEEIELPVKLKVYDSVFVPLAKWAMLMTGNYRCIQKGGIQSIKDAVHSDLERSRAVYEWVKTLCFKLGANEDDLVPFEKYAKAAESLLKPSSAARALAAGVPNIERVDRLVRAIAAQKGMKLHEVDNTVALIDGWLEANRKKAEQVSSP